MDAHRNERGNDMQNVKKLFKAYEAAEIACDKAEAEMVELDTDEAEAAFDAAYKAQGEAAQAFAEAVESFTRGMVDAKTARRMLIIKRDQLESLIARVA